MIMKPSPTRSTFRTIPAFTSLDLLVVLATLLIVSGLLLPTLFRPRRGTIRINCVNNLKQVGLAFRIWSGDNGDHYPMAVFTNVEGASLLAPGTNVFVYFQAMSNELSTPKLLICP